MTPRTKKHLIVEYRTFLETRGLTLDVKVGYLLSAVRHDPMLKSISDLPLVDGAQALRDFLKTLAKPKPTPVVSSSRAMVVSG